jgi:hypothetical protein
MNRSEDIEKGAISRGKMAPFSCALGTVWIGGPTRELVAVGDDLLDEVNDDLVSQHGSVQGVSGTELAVGIADLGAVIGDHFVSIRVSRVPRVL